MITEQLVPSVIMHPNVTYDVFIYNNVVVLLRWSLIVYNSQCYSILILLDWPLIVFTAQCYSILVYNETTNYFTRFKIIASTSWFSCIPIFKTVMFLTRFSRYSLKYFIHAVFKIMY